MNQAPRPPFRLSARLVPLVMACAVLTAGCSGDESEPAATPSSSSPTVKEPGDAPTIDIEPIVSIGRIVGKLAKKDRPHVRDRVARVAEHWMYAAYLGGDYPRANFKGSWVGFTSRAKVLAHRDKALTSNDAIGKRIDSVSADKMAIRVDLVTVKRRPVGSTAHVILKFDTEGKIERSVRIGGRLLLTPTKHGWKVFAYDLNRGNH